MARSICAFASDKLDCEIVEIGALPLYSQDHDADLPEEVVRFREKIAAADGVLFVTPEYNRGVPGVLKNAIDVGSRPYGKSVWNQMPAAIVSASPGSIGGFGANHQVRQACVFLNMPVMQQPEAYLGGVTDDRFDADGCLTEGPFRELVLGLAAAFADWVDIIVRSRRLLARTRRRTRGTQGSRRSPTPDRRPAAGSQRRRSLRPRSRIGASPAYPPYRPAMVLIRAAPLSLSVRCRPDYGVAHGPAVAAE